MVGIKTTRGDCDELHNAEPHSCVRSGYQIDFLSFPNIPDDDGACDAAGHEKVEEFIHETKSNGRHVSESIGFVEVDFRCTLDSRNYLRRDDKLSTRLIVTNGKWIVFDENRFEASESL